MSKITVTTELLAGVPTPTAGNNTIFVDSVTKTLKTKNDAGTVTDYAAPGTAITALTSEVTASGPGSAVATVANSAVLGKVLTGLSPVGGLLAATDTLLQAFNKLANVQNTGYFGNAQDSDVTISVDTTLTRDSYYNNLIIQTGSTLFTGGFRIFARSIDVQTGASIDRSGANAASGTGATGLTAGTTGLSGAGGNGGTTAAGTNGGGVTSAVGGAGGAGGAGGTTAGGTSGTSTVPTAVNGGVESAFSAPTALRAQTLTGTIFQGGGGGAGGGGGGAGNQGGGGGAGAGVIMIAAKSLTGSGIIRAMGGNGLAAVGTNGGGGGGGGGGSIILVTENDTTATSLTFTIAGGTGGVGNGTGSVGANGANGRVIRVRT